jgi:hypothetical protein
MKRSGMRDFGQPGLAISPPASAPTPQEYKRLKRRDRRVFRTDDLVVREEGPVFGRCRARQSP